ncbi:MAG: transporter, partial [Terriglobales bacterium]
MLARTPTVLLALILVVITPSYSQDQAPIPNAPSPINTDRPAFTNSSVVVPTGSFQAENGFLATGNFGQTVVDAPETLVRFGLTKRTEFRFTVPDYFDNVTTGAGWGFGDLALGVKQQLGPLHKFDLSL